MTNTRENVTSFNLNSVMDFDHVIRVHSDGTVSDETNVHAPDLDGDSVTSGWTLMTGYSGQDGYSGPIMHESEFIGGAMASDILATPGIYVALVSYGVNEAEDMDDLIGNELSVDGWAVARKDGAVRFIVEDWTSKRLSPKTFDSYEEAWAFIYETWPDPSDDDNSSWFDEYYATEVFE